ncbi:MAG: D-alanine--D-alanine ligase [Clostridia bacterium]|nr:D-alanine--D-alanine ligase [Clostridia bacterium]
MKINLAVFFGCISVEHEVSIISAVQAMGNVNKEKYNCIPVYVTKSGEMLTGEHLLNIENYKDLPTLIKNAAPVTFVKENGTVYMTYLKSGLFSNKKKTEINLAFPIVHGTNCEDGTIQGYLEFLGLPYIGCDVLSSALGMDKAACKHVLKANGINVLDCVTFTARQYAENPQAVIEMLNKKIGLPLIIKPVNLGSSVGISVVKQQEKLIDSIELALSFSETVLCERAITNLTEVNCSVLGDKDNCKASVLEQPLSNSDMLSYEEKYLSSSKSKGMASLGRKIPADIPADTTLKIQQMATEAFRAVGASGVIRIDFMIDNDSGEIYLNELNTIPGSLAFYLWDASGLKYPQLIDELADLAFKRNRQRSNLMFTIKTNILSSAGGFGSKGAKGSKL